MIKALTFDTGGTILDWHTGFYNVFQKIGKVRGLDRDWAGIANLLRKNSLQIVTGQGKIESPKYTFDDAHRLALEKILQDESIHGFTEEDIYKIAYEAPHNFRCWSDFPEASVMMRRQYMMVSFTLLSYRLIIDTAKKNDLIWDAVFSCEGIGKYKPLPEAYETVARYLQLRPDECCMVACHSFDLDAARKVGFRTACVRRQAEWGPKGTIPDIKDEDYDIVVDDFPTLLSKLPILDK